jgi:hypothetical protein
MSKRSLSLMIAFLGLSAIVCAADCRDGCYLVSFWNDGGNFDYTSTTNVCITYAGSTGNPGIGCPITKTQGGSCDMSTDVQRATMDICRCCSKAVVRGQNMNNCNTTSGFTPYIIETRCGGS